MYIKSYIPNPILQEFIEEFVILEVGYNEVVKDFYPNNAALMCFDITQRHFRFGEEDFRFAPLSENVSLCFVGVLDRHYSVKSIPKKTIQVLFTPCGAYRFLRMKLSDFTNLATDAQLIMPGIKDTIAAMEDLYADDLACIDLLQQYFINRLNSSKIRISENMAQISYACDEIKRHAGDIAIKELCRRVNMSENRFRVHFSEKVGITPKAFCLTEKLIQLQKTLQDKTDINWIAMCEQLNYFDQAHFIKSFKSHFGCTPAQFQKNNA